MARVQKNGGGGGYKKFLRRELSKSEREAYARKMRGLRKKASDEKAERKRRLKEAKHACDERVKHADAAAQAAFAHARELALKAQKKATELRNRARVEKKSAARDKCQLDRRHVEDEAAAKIAAVKAEETAEREFHRGTQAIERAQRGRPAGKQAVKKRAVERRSESDDLVRHNLENAKHLLPVWERVKHRIKADKHRTRSEVFLDFIHDNPDEVAAAQSFVRDEDLAEAERAHWEGQRGMMGDTEEVPF